MALKKLALVLKPKYSGEEKRTHHFEIDDQTFNVTFGNIEITISDRKEHVYLEDDERLLYISEKYSNLTDDDRSFLLGLASRV